MLPHPVTRRPLDGVRVLAFVGDDYEDLELWYPKLRFEEAGAHLTLAGEMEATDFHGLLIPGGWMPDKLRRHPKVLSLTREFANTGKLVAAICHGGWIPISAGVYRGVRVTGSPGIKDDLVNAGAIWEDTPVVVDRHFVSSRKPADLPAFTAAAVDLLATGVAV